MNGIERRNPVAPALRLGINQPKVIPNRHRERRIKHRHREFEFDEA